MKFSIIIFISFLFLSSVLTFVDLFYYLNDEIFIISSFISTKLVQIFSAMLIIVSALQIFNYKKNLAFGYIDYEILNTEFEKNELYIEIEKVKYPAELLEKPLKGTNFKLI